MNEKTKIRAFSRVVPMIYAYETPGIPYNEGWIKIGYTESQTVRKRISQQTHTAGIRAELRWQDNAIYKDGSGETFTDHDFHSYLVTERAIERKPGTEWFRLDAPTSHAYFNTFAVRDRSTPAELRSEYLLRAEQSDAVAMTADYFLAGGKEFLWNAKPRFGKTLSAYDLIRRLGFMKVLIVTNRPSIANSWAEDFRKFIGWRGDYGFVSETDALSCQPGILSRGDYFRELDNNPDFGMIAFESLQGLKGSLYFGGNIRKLEWIANLEFDLLIVDEAQEGVDTAKTDFAFEKINRKHTLYLSGTPFKALASNRFSADQIYNWSYSDEQSAKAAWAGVENDDYNPYEALPRMSMWTYELSKMIADQLQQGLILDDEAESVNYAFDLNEFFATNDDGKLRHEEEVRKFLDSLTTGEKYPFSSDELRSELAHTLWILDRVASVKALAKLLKNHPVFKDYQIVVAAGDGKLNDDEETERAYEKVKSAIAENEKTITLSVGQLTVGVTIPEWSGVLMLCNLSSPSAYMQACFRVQNPCLIHRNGVSFRKENAYVFDFDPARTLIIFDEYANNLSPETTGGAGTENQRGEKIRTLLNFFPVLGEDDEGRMVELDAAAVLSIPRRLKSREVVRRGFMSNFLFTNITNIFSAPAVVKEIVEKLTPAHEEAPRNRGNSLDSISSVHLDSQGEISVSNEIVIGKSQKLFGEKIYETLKTEVNPVLETVETVNPVENIRTQIKPLKNALNDTILTNVLAPIAADSKLTASEKTRIGNEIKREIESNMDKIANDYEHSLKIAKATYEERLKNSDSQNEIRESEATYQTEVKRAHDALNQQVSTFVENTIQNKPAELIEKIEKFKINQDKKAVEDTVRAHLRGFARTIPSFIMAYDDGTLTLSNFDQAVEEDVFIEVTGITKKDFRFLRDGGTYADTETGESVPFAGHLFDETVFNDSVAEFRNKRTELANYFDESQEEDIFDYIPPQKTNQIFTPKWVVKMMVDKLEEQNPGCFDDPTKTFADLYMKSGLYITEIVKRLYRSKGLIAAFPNETDRIRHILQHQVYGMAPSRIIYLIATNFILGFDPKLKLETKNFVMADAAEASKNNRLEELVKVHFGE